MLSTLIYFKITEMFPGITRIFKLHWRRSTNRSVWFCQPACTLQSINVPNCVALSLVRPGTRSLRNPFPRISQGQSGRKGTWVWFWTLEQNKHCCSWKAAHQTRWQKSAWNSRLSLLPSALPPHGWLCWPPAAWDPMRRLGVLTYYVWRGLGLP